MRVSNSSPRLSLQRCRYLVRSSDYPLSAYNNATRTTFRLLSLRSSLTPGGFFQPKRERYVLSGVS
jgi:hypothetical protein